MKRAPVIGLTFLIEIVIGMGLFAGGVVVGLAVCPPCLKSDVPVCPQVTGATPISTVNDNGKQLCNYAPTYGRATFTRGIQ